MPETADIIFLVCLFLILYTYAGYPLLLFLLIKIKKAIRKKRNYPQDGFLPVTLIVAAWNEEKMIRKKIENSLALDYPKELLKLVFITDGSSDNTPHIIKEYADITLLHEPGRRGKPAAMNRAVSRIGTPVIIFSDANTFLNRDSIKLIMHHYSDPLVGGVAGEKRIIKDGPGSIGKGEGLYWQYESLLKKLDSSLKTTVGAAGELFSIRTSLYSFLPENTILEDFVQSLLVCTKGYVIRYEPNAYAQETASLSVKDEMERKIRISAGAFQAMGMVGKLFNVFRYPVTSFLFISHRILRWTLCPLALVALFFCSVVLFRQTRSIFFETLVVLQVMLYISAALGWWFALRNRRIKAIYLPFYFVFMNFCVFAGFFRFLRKRQSVLWHRAERHS